MQDEEESLEFSVLPMPYINEVGGLEGYAFSGGVLASERLKKDEPISTSQPNPGEAPGLGIH